MLKTHCPSCGATVIPEVTDPHHIAIGATQTVSYVECTNCGHRLGRLEWFDSP